MTRLASALRSPWVRAGFVTVAVGAAVVAVWASWPDVETALDELAPGPVVAAVMLSPLYALASMYTWRVVLGDLGSRLPHRDAFAVFFVSQLGKYVPGSLWNVVASAELGADRQVPRRRSLTAMAVALLLSVVSGVSLGAAGLALATDAARDQFGVVIWLLPVLVLVALPPVTNRAAGLALLLLRRAPLEQQLTARGTLTSLAWAVTAWALSGAQVWALGVAAGMEASARSYLVCTGAYALAWALGFLAVPVPAGVGIREVVLAALMGSLLDNGGVIVVVLLSRVILTVVDLGLALVATTLVTSAARRDRTA